jgi:hypothetical protein
MNYPEKFTDRVLFRSPPVLTAAIARGCAKAGMLPSEYIRQAVMVRLQQDGIIDCSEARKIKPSSLSHVNGRL